MPKNMLSKLKESLISVLPITAIILIVGLSTSSLTGYDLLAFGIGAVLLILGMSFYSLGTDNAIGPIGEHLGARISRIKKPWLILLCCFVIGVIVTVAEPDLSVLATQVSSINKWILIFTVAAGVGIFLLLAVLRMLLKIDLKWMLIAFYAIIFILVIFTSEGFIPLAFDSGGVTTGPITVPFILALGAGVSASIVGDGEEDSFGLVGVCSIGPILAVLILGLIYGSDGGTSNISATSYGTFGEMASAFGVGSLASLKDVGIALAPIAVVFLFAQIFTLKLPVKQLIQIIVGLLFTYFGLVIFLTGVNVGFMPAGIAIGNALGSIHPLLIVPIGTALGAVIVLAEPAVHVLTKHVESVTNGVIKRKTMLIIFSISMALALGLSMLRIALKINILWLLAPGYAIALILTFFTPKIFTAIAFDSGGVASGPMTATFLLPFAMGACVAVGGNIMTDAFGVVAMVAMTPLITLQAAGLIYKIKLKRIAQHANAEFNALLAREGEIIDLED